MQIEIRVEQKHIDAGERYSTTHCPMAMAINEQHPELGECHVTKCAISFNEPGAHIPPLERKYHLLDKDSIASDFVEFFTLRGKGAVRPFTFTLDL